jgi:hypothetical protein
MDAGGIAGIAVGFGLLVLIPIVAIMTEHQRKMARIIHGLSDKEERHGPDDALVIGLKAGIHKHYGKSESNEVLDELRAMRGELADLRMQVASLQGAKDEEVRARLSQ